MVEIFRTSSGSLHQCDQDNCFYLHFQDRQTSFRVCGLLAFKKKIDQVDLVALLLDERNRSGLEIVRTCQNQAIFVLTIREILELKELLAGTLVMLELNSILHQKLQYSLS